MQPCLPARRRVFLICGVIFFLMVLAGCQGQQKTIVAPAAVEGPTSTPLPPTSTSTRYPTLPSVWTPRPQNETLIRGTATAAPSPTATPNHGQTIVAATTAVRAMVCEKYPDAWQIRVGKSAKVNWCSLSTVPFTLYEYALDYPSKWVVNTFGDVHPNLIFATGRSSIELRLYQVFAYETRSYKGSVEDAPDKAAFCDKTEKCLPVVDPNEKELQRNSFVMGSRQVVIFDTQDGQRYVRRYFFKVPFRANTGSANRLFFFKLYTTKPLGALTSGEIPADGDAAEKELLSRIETMIATIHQDR